ncbi:protein EXORDIUM-like 6 [Ricinus communis]|uniref:protein EXORDIUM-like 6 n=1 Tax=Ricinus communis TaxID=3988 RepID=UPI00201AE2EE|nr:protein EXORDIUM-like 6 [Ricinus communis]
MASSLQNLSPIIVLSLCFLLPSCLSITAPPATPVLTHHGGPLLTGNLNLAIIWYGQFGHKHKKLLRRFIKSLNYNGAANLEPQVSQWWNVVEGFQEAAGKGKGPIKVRVAKQVTDTSYAMGNVITAEYVKILKQKVAGAGIPVIFTAKDVSVQGLCMGKCASHGISDDQPFLIVGNPEIECPGECAWPFHKADTGPVGAVLKPPNGHVAGDAMVIAFAQGLVDLVTNPFKTGFFHDNIRDPVEASEACRGIFGSGALVGNAGKIRIDPATGGAFNAHGSNGNKFLLPAIWNPKTKSCFTLM